jgi:hypothetical protein
MHLLGIRGPRDPVVCASTVPAKKKKNRKEQGKEQQQRNTAHMRQNSSPQTLSMGPHTEMLGKRKKVATTQPHAARNPYLKQQNVARQALHWHDEVGFQRLLLQLGACFTFLFIQEEEEGEEEEEEEEENDEQRERRANRHQERHRTSSRRRSRTEESKGTTPQPIDTLRKEEKLLFFRVRSLRVAMASG